MKPRIHMLLVFLLAGLLCPAVTHADPPPKKPKSKSKTSCTVLRGKVTQSDQVEYHIGLVAGRNVATIKTKDNSGQEHITGLMAGVSFRAIWPKGFVLQPEILYSQKGCVFVGHGINYGIDYLEVPVMAMYRLHLADIKPFVFVAPYGAYAIKISEKDFITGDDTFSDQINKYDFGFGIGGGLDVWRAQVSLRYSYGFAQIVKDETHPIRNNVFTVAASFFF